MSTREISPEDLDSINRTFKKSGAQILVKDSKGNRLRSQMGTVNAGTGYAFADYRGRTLARQKSVIPHDGKQVTVGEAGQRFEDIPQGLRELAAWADSDFQ